LGTDLSPPSDSEVVRVSEKYEISESAFNVLYVGNYNSRKNVDQIIEACRDLSYDGLDLNLLLAGSDPPESELSDVAGNFRENVSYLGYVPDGDLEALYGSADLFVYPSSYEGFGLPVLESMACGTPVITSNVSSLPEVVGDTGLTVSPKNSIELSEAIERVYSNDGLREQLRQDGLNRARKMSWERTARETIEACEELY
jgi:glycosyltransferase involved in cell wall biosynthesis